MPRDASGNYAGPANSVNPAVPFSHIESGAFNALISDIEEALTDSLSRSGDGAMQDHLNMDSHRITNVTDPSGDQDAATKKFVTDTIAATGSNQLYKASVVVSTVVAGTLASDFENGDTVNGVVLATGDRILINAQGAAIGTPHVENGIYTVNASGAPTRATDADAGSELVGATVPVLGGTTNGNTLWICVTPATITIGVTAIGFTLLPSAGVAIASQAEAEAGTENTKTMTPLRSTQQRVKARKDMGQIYATDFGAIVKNSQAAAAANLTTIHAARDYIIANDGVGEVVLPSGIIFVNASIVWRTGIRYAGMGRQQTIVKLADASNCDVFQTISFDTYAMERDNDVTKLEIRNFGLRDLAIDGNKGTQSLGAKDQGNGISIYGHSYSIERVNVYNCKAFGFWSEYAGSAPATFSNWVWNYAPQIHMLCISTCDAGGIVNRGPNDCQWGHVIAQFNGVDGVTSEAGATYLDKGRGVDIESGSYPTHGTVYDGGGEYGKIHSFSNFGLNFRTNTWIKGELIETEGSNGSNVKFESGPATTQTAITQLLSYAPNVDNNSGVKVVDVQQPRVSIGILRIRMDAPTTGSAPYAAMTGLYIAADHFSCPDLHIDGLSVNRTTIAIEVADNVEHFNIAGLIKDLPTVDPTNQSVNGSFGLHLGNADYGVIDLSMYNVAVMARRNSTSSRGNRGRIQGVLTSGQLGLVGNWGIDSVYSADAIDFSYDDNGTLITYNTNTGPIHKNAVTANTTIAVPAGMALKGIFFANGAASAVTGGVKIGTTSGATDVVAAQAVGASAVGHVADAALLKRLFSTSAGQSLFIQAVTSWASASVSFRFTLERLY